MRVAILAPNYYAAETGNAVTVRRIERHLKLLGCEVRIFPVDQLSGEQMLSGIKEFSPQLLHAFHGYHGGRVAHAIFEQLAVPYLVTLTGTDVYQALCDQRSHDTHVALRGAARLVVFHGSIRRRLAEHLPSLEERTAVIRQGVELSGDSSVASSGGGECIFLLPAGIRRVKNILFPLTHLAPVHEAHPEVKLLLVGPVIDTAYAAEVMDAVEALSFAQYLGPVSHDAMAGFYRHADVVLNTSLAEGGMANTLLEAMAHGKPVLVSDIEGNRSLVKDGCNGLLYRDSHDFESKACQLISDPHLRESLGKSGKALVREKHSPEKEAAAYLELYEEIAASTSHSPSN